MSKREAVLCDLPSRHALIEPSPHVPTDPCPQLSVGVCIGCGRDICMFHTRHRAGALQIKAIIRQEQNNEGPERVWKEFTSTPVTFCSECDLGLFRLDFAGSEAMIARIAASAHEIIRATLAGESLK